LQKPLADQPTYQPGSVEDFDRLYQASYPKLLRTVYAVLGDHAAAEDCVQDAFVRAFHAWPRFRPERPPEAWLHQIAINGAISYRRKLRLRQVGELLRRLGRPGVEPDPAEVVAGGEVVAALARLPVKEAASFVLRHYHGYNNREIAQAIGVSERTVGARLAGARQRLARDLGPAYGQLPTPPRPGVALGESGDA
jgi:RNA polymerase sigma-70 factor (ECF subfamily)